tara:strand:+ start:3057 stop:4169 length:1113 start_codon:yes stop_codon:yes gene_type:complete
MVSFKQNTDWVCASVTAPSYSLRTDPTGRLSWPCIAPDKNIDLKQIVTDIGAEEIPDGYNLINTAARSNAEIVSDIARLDDHAASQKPEYFLGFAAKWGSLGFTQLWRDNSLNNQPIPPWVTNSFGPLTPSENTHYDPLIWISRHAETIGFLLELIHHRDSATATLERILFQHELSGIAESLPEARLYEGKSLMLHNFKGRANALQHVPNPTEPHHLLAIGLKLNSSITFEKNAHPREMAETIIEFCIVNNLKQTSITLQGIKLVAPIQAAYLHLRDLFNAEVGIYLKSCRECGKLFVSGRKQSRFCPGLGSKRISSCSNTYRKRRSRYISKLESISGLSKKLCVQAWDESNFQFEVARKRLQMHEQDKH